MVPIDDVVRLFANMAFPSAVAVFLLYYITSRLNGRLDRLSGLIEENTRTLEQLIDRIELWMDVKHGERSSSQSK